MKSLKISAYGVSQSLLWPSLWARLWELSKQCHLWNAVVRQSDLRKVCAIPCGLWVCYKTSRGQFRRLDSVWIPKDHSEDSWKWFCWLDNLRTPKGCSEDSRRQFRWYLKDNSTDSQKTIPWAHHRQSANFRTGFHGKPRQITVEVFGFFVSNLWRSSHLFQHSMVLRKLALQHPAFTIFGRMPDVFAAFPFWSFPTASIH